MRLLTVLLQCCALLQCAAAKDAYLYTFNDERRSPSTKPSMISADTAFAIASRRQGLTNALSLEGVDEQALSQIAEHGGYQQPLFSEATITNPARVLVRIQTNRPEALQLAYQERSFKIQSPTKDILTLQPEGVDGKHYTFKLVSKENVRLVCRLWDTAPILKDKTKLLKSSGKSILEILDVIKSFLSNSKDLGRASIDVDFTPSKLSQSSITIQIDLLIDYFQSCSHQPTLLILPPTSQLASSTALLNRRQESEEEPLDPIIPATPDVLNNPSTYKSNTTLPAASPAASAPKNPATTAQTPAAAMASAKPPAQARTASNANAGAPPSARTRTAARRRICGLVPLARRRISASSLHCSPYLV